MKRVHEIVKKKLIVNCGQAAGGKLGAAPTWVTLPIIDGRERARPVRRVLKLR